MTSKMRVHMEICDRVSTVEVTDQKYGTYAVKVTTSCPNVKEFAEGLEVLEMTDLTDKHTCKVFERMREAKISANCLFPSGLPSAAWLEAGLIAKSRAKDKKGNRIEFVFDEKG
jgi:hypothetical protein